VPKGLRLLTNGAAQSPEPEHKADVQGLHSSLDEGSSQPRKRAEVEEDELAGPGSQSLNCDTPSTPGDPTTAPSRPDEAGRIQPDVARPTEAVVSAPSSTDIARAETQSLEADEPESSADDCPSFISPPPYLEGLFGSVVISKVMPAIESSILKCADLSGALGLFSSEAITITIPDQTGPDEIREFVEGLFKGSLEEASTKLLQIRALGAASEVRIRYQEAFYWNLIRVLANELSFRQPPTPRPHLAEFTVSQEIAARKFIAHIGYTVDPSLDLCTIWKRLHEMRVAGVKLLLAYRTEDLDNLCTSWSEEVPLWEVMLEFEKVYLPDFLRIEGQAVTERSRIIAALDSQFRQVPLIE
jgi:hypothetical protein